MPQAPTKRRAHATSGIIAHGDIPQEYERFDNVLLQQKMKPRHIQMIAVGGECVGVFVSFDGGSHRKTEEPTLSKSHHARIWADKQALSARAFSSDLAVR